MSSGSAAEVRLVRCPRCLQILPEFPHVSLYECGGCGAHLQGTEYSLDQKYEKDQFLPGEEQSEDRNRSGDDDDEQQRSHGCSSTWEEEQARVPAEVPPSVEIVPMEQEELLAGGRLEVGGNGCCPSDTSAFVVRPSSAEVGSAILQQMLKSPATRSSRVYYDGGLSSDEANPGKSPDGHKNLRRSSSERRREEQFGMKTKWRSKSVLCDDASSKPTKPFPLPPPVMNCCCSSTPFCQPAHLSPYQIRSHSGPTSRRHRHHRGPSHDPSHNEAACLELEKMRMCFERLDQHDTDRCINGWRAMDRRAPVFNDYTAVGEDERFPNMNCAAFHGRFDGGNHHQHGQGTHCFHPNNHSGRAFSSSSSPQLHAEARELLALGNGRKVEDEVQRDDEEMRGERPKMLARYLLPIAGGAPLITCAKCSTLLQLPADFLIHGRKFHLLRCGSCSIILKFSLENRIRLLPHRPAPDAPPPCHARSDDAASRRSAASSSSPATDEKATSSGKKVNPAKTRSSPLHKLMGYASAYQMMMGGGEHRSRMKMNP